MTFNEADVRRSAVGRFSDKIGSQPELALTRPKKYHRDLGFPSNFTPSPKPIHLTYSRHAEGASHDDRYGTIPKFEKLDPKDADLIEVEIENGKAVKYLYRAPVPGAHRGKELDVCLAVMPGETKRDPWFVKTVWFNERDDLHRTLDASKYDKP